MSNKNLAILGLLAVVMVTLAVAVDKVAHRQPANTGLGGYLIEGMDPAAVAKIVIKGGDSEVTLSRADGMFVVDNKDGYPAKTSEVNSLITRCMDVKLAGTITSDQKNFKDLGVTEEAASTIVKFLKDDGSLLTGIIIGNAKEQGQGKYVRQVNGKDVYLALDAPFINKNATGYIEQTLVSVEQENIESVAVNTDGSSYRIVRAEDDEIELSSVPADKEAKKDELKKVFNVLTDLRANDVMRAVEAIAFNDKYVCRLKDSTVYRFDIGEKDDKTYARVTAEFTDTSPVEVTRGVAEDEEVLKAKEAKLLARDAAAEFAQKNAGWVFEIPSWKAENMIKPLDELLADKEAERPATDDLANSQTPAKEEVQMEVEASAATDTTQEQPENGPEVEEEKPT